MPNIQRFREPMAERINFDAEHCPAPLGWAQIDTTYDASYYGHWANPFTRVLVSFVEGDVCITTCADDAEFAAEIRTMHEFHAETRSWKGIDTMCRCDIEQRFTQCGLADLFH